MSVKLNNDLFNKYLLELSKKYKIYAPKLKKGEGKFAETDLVTYAEIISLDEIELSKKSYFSPKEIFYPIRETLFYFNKEDIEVPDIDLKPIVILARPCDLNGVERLDNIFLLNGPEKDFYYQRRRELIKFVMIECLEGFDSCFCVSMNSNKFDNYDAAIRFEENNVVMDIVDRDLITETIKGLATIEFVPEYIKENKIKVNIPPIDKVKKENFAHPLWKEYAGRCIACGRCNTSCITCSCYSMQDTQLSDDGRVGERRRVWSGCHVDGFTDMAGGHSFRDSNGERMRFKTMHKINDYYKRFDEHMCVGCGRCDDVCPEYISFSKCINKLNQIIIEEDKK